mgnify:CR=1 FL=1
MTGKTRRFSLLGRELTFFNQRCQDWTHPYAWQGQGNLADSGCGIFGLCHGIQWLTGCTPSPEALADFSCAHDGRGDDGTDRPVLLSALQLSGEAARLGFRYDGDGLRNDLDTLFDFLLHEKGVALCNLRVGHIVCLVAARQQDGERQLLAIDSHSESADARVRDSVREVIPASEIAYSLRNASGLAVGTATGYAAFWVRANQPRDFNLLPKG